MKKLIMILVLLSSLMGCEYSLIDPTAIQEGFTEIEVSVLPRGGYDDSYDWTCPEIENLFNAFSRERYSDYETIEMLSTLVYYRTKYVRDPEVYGMLNVWQTPERTYNLRTGDCEDFSILTMYLVKKYLNRQCSIIRLRREDGGHAILKVYGKDREYYVDYKYIYSDLSSFTKKGYSVKEEVAYEEAMWICQMMCF